MLEPVMRGTGKDIVRETELFDIPQALKVFSRRAMRCAHAIFGCDTHVSIKEQIHGENETGRGQCESGRKRTLHLP